MALARGFALLATLLLVTPAGAQQTSGGAANAAPKWIVRCSNTADASRLACRLSQSLVSGRNGARVLTVAIVPRPDRTSMRIGLPHGTDLREGVTLTIDRGTPRPLDIVTADANGSYADLDLDARFLSSLRAGRVLNVAFASRAGQRIALDVDLSGFSAAYDLVPR